MHRTARLALATGVALIVTLPVVGGIASAAPSGGAGSSAASVTRTTAETTITVREGDSLAGIAWRHGVRLATLLRSNSLQLTSVIHPGDTLVIPAGATIPPNGPVAGAATSTTSSPSSPATPTASTGPGTDYVVLPGDALAGIAWRHGVTLGALVKANNIVVTSVIMPGQQLRVPAATRPIPTGIAAAPAASPVAATTAPTAVAASQGGSLQTLLSHATAQVGAPYRFYSAGPETFDCSGLVVAAFRQIGMSVPHQSRALARLGTPVDWHSQSISAGDLVFTSAVNDPDLITHVGIALDSRRWVHAIGFGRTVSVGTLPTTERIMAVRRLALP